MNKLQHIAIIMDGNGRWASARNKSRTFGHVRGVRVAKKIISFSQEIKISYLTLYAFSSENWMRPQTEVQLLMKLLYKYLVREREHLKKENICFKVLGQIERLPQEIVKEIVKTVEETSQNTGMVLTLALSYSGREDILQAAKKIIEIVQLEKLSPAELDENIFSQYLETSSLPDPDLVIRTSGEQRLSNFLLWQSAYSELYFTNTLWPDFTKDDLLLAIDEYHKRERRFGKVIQPAADKL